MSFDSVSTLAVPPDLTLPFRVRAWVLALAMGVCFWGLPAFGAESAGPAGGPQSSSSVSESPGKRVVVAADWKVGDKKYFEVARAKLTRPPDGTKSEVVDFAIYSVEVMSKEADGHWVHRWRMEAERLAAPVLAASAASAASDAQTDAHAMKAPSTAADHSTARQAFLNLEDRRVDRLLYEMASLPFDIRVDEEGNVLEVVNRSEIREQAKGLFKRTLRAPHSDNFVMSDGWLARLLMRDLARVYMPVGGYDQPEGVEESESTLPLNFVNASVPSVATRWLTPKREDGTFNLMVWNSVRADEYGPAIAKMLAATVLVGEDEKQRHEVSALLQSAEYSLRAVQSFVLREAEPWLVAYRSERVVSVEFDFGEFEQVNSVQIAAIPRLPTPEEFAMHGFVAVKR